MKNRHAQALAALARGVPKKFTPDEIQKRTQRILLAQAQRAAAMRAERTVRVSLKPRTRP